MGLPWELDAERRRYLPSSEKSAHEKECVRILMALLLSEEPISPQNEQYIRQRWQCAPSTPTPNKGVVFRQMAGNLLAAILADPEQKLSEAKDCIPSIRFTIAAIFNLAAQSNDRARALGHLMSLVYRWPLYAILTDLNMIDRLEGGDGDCGPIMKIGDLCALNLAELTTYAPDQDKQQVQRIVDELAIMGLQLSVHES